MLPIIAGVALAFGVYKLATRNKTAAPAPVVPATPTAPSPRLASAIDALDVLNAQLDSIDVAAITPQVKDDIPIIWADINRLQEIGRTTAQICVTVAQEQPLPASFDRVEKMHAVLAEIETMTGLTPATRQIARDAAVIAYSLPESRNSTFKSRALEYLADPKRGLDDITMLRLMKAIA